VRVGGQGEDQERELFKKIGDSILNIASFHLCLKFPLFFCPAVNLFFPSGSTSNLPLAQTWFLIVV